MYARLFHPDQLPEYQSFFLFGPRTTGKSTLVQEYLKECKCPILSYNLLQSDDFLKLQSDPSVLRHEVDEKIKHAQNGILQVHIDEVQKIPPLLDEVHGLIETYKRKVRFILTGSSARKLKRGGANLLAGRAWQQWLHPLTFHEIGKDFSLPLALQYGTLPPVLNASEPEKVRILKSYVHTYLREEIQQEAMTRRLDSFHRFLEAAAIANGQLVNMSKVAAEASVPRRTVASYYQILEDTLIGFFLSSWGHRLSRKALVTHGKFYFFDTGVLNTLTQTLSMTPTPKNPVFGRLFEHFCILEFVRLHSYKGTEHRFGFFRTRAGTEVDLVEEKGKRIRAIEIKAQSTVRGEDLSGLHHFAEEFQNAEKIVISLVPRPLEINGVRCLPWDDFFQEELSSG